MALIPSCLGQNFTILEQNSQILCKNREKLEIIISIQIWWYYTLCDNILC